jgi:hypothetical protein
LKTVDAGCETALELFVRLWIVKDSLDCRDVKIGREMAL